MPAARRPRRSRRDLPRKTSNAYSRTNTAPAAAPRHAATTTPAPATPAPPPQASTTTRLPPCLRAEPCRHRFPQGMVQGPAHDDQKSHQEASRSAHRADRPDAPELRKPASKGPQPQRRYRIVTFVCARRRLGTEVHVSDTDQPTNPLVRASSPACRVVSEHLALSTSGAVCTDQDEDAMPSGVAACRKSFMTDSHRGDAMEMSIGRRAPTST